MATQGLRVCVGHGRMRAAGFLSMDDRADADIPYRSRDRRLRRLATRRHRIDHRLMRWRDARSPCAQSVRLGGRGNYRKCIAVAEGEFVKFLDDDGVLLPACVERLVDAFRNAPDVTLATSHRHRIDATGAVLSDQAATMRIVDVDTLIEGRSLGNVMLMTPLNVVGEPSTALFRRSDVADLAPDYFRFQAEEGRGVIDMTLWATLLLRGDAAYVRDTLSHFRVHPDQQQGRCSAVAKVRRRHARLAVRLAAAGPAQARRSVHASRQALSSRCVERLGRAARALVPGDRFVERHAAQRLTSASTMPGRV